MEIALLCLIAMAAAADVSLQVWLINRGG